MEKLEGRFCVLCLRTNSNDYFEEIGNALKEMLGVLHLKLNSHITEECFICCHCLGSVKKCFDFKSTCLNSDSLIILLYNDEIKPGLHPKVACLQRSQIMATDEIRSQEICRLCVKLNEKSYCKPFSEIEEDMLQKCVPKLNFNLTKDPVICASCLNSLKFYFQFLKNCVNTQKQIIMYGKFHGIDSKRQINLSKHKKSITKEDPESKIDENNVLTTEAIVENKSGEFDGEIVENDTKISIEEIIIKREINEEPLNRSIEGLDIFCGTNGNYLKPGLKFENENEEFSRENVENCIDTDAERNIEQRIINDLENVENYHLKSEIKFEEENEAFSSRNVENDIAIDVEKITMKTEIGPLKLPNGEMGMTNEQNELSAKQCDFQSFGDAPNSSPMEIQTIYLQDRSETSDQNLHNMEEKMFIHNYKQGVLTHRELPEVALYKCEICLFVTNSKYSLKVHMVTHQQLWNATIYKCESCLFVTKHRGSLRTHQLTHRELSEVNVYKCDNCSYITKMKSSLKLHMLTHREFPEVPLYKCEECSYVSKTKGRLKAHTLRHRLLSEVTTYKCQSCFFETKRKGALRMHMLNHRELSVTVYQCESCPYVTKIKGSLKAHALTHRELSEVKVYECKNCPYVTKIKGNLNSHILSHQDLSDVTAFKCNSCTFKTKHKSSLKRHTFFHRKLSGEVIYKCESCSYMTDAKSSIKSHMLIHQKPSTATAYKCQICLFETNRKASIKIHMQAHREHSETLTYECDSCPYATNITHSFERHVLTHQELYKCESCSYVATSKRNLYSHILIHKELSIGAAYKCKICPYFTNKKKYLNSHALIHKEPSEVTMYKCEICSFETKRRGSLNRHKRARHPNVHK